MNTNVSLFKMFNGLCPSLCKNPESTYIYTLSWFFYEKLQQDKRMLSTESILTQIEYKNNGFFYL